MATYQEIQEWVKKRYSFTPKTCWIADVKEQCGLQMRVSPNRKEKKRLHPCPKNHVEHLKNAFRYFNMI